MKQGIQCIEQNKRRMYYVGKKKKYGSDTLAMETQKVLHIPVTGNFDERTVICLNRLSDNSFTNLKTLVNKNLQNT